MAAANVATDGRAFNPAVVVEAYRALGCELRADRLAGGVPFVWVDHNRAVPQFDALDAPDIDALDCLFPQEAADVEDLALWIERSFIDAIH